MAVIVPIILCQDGDPLGSPKALFRLQFIAFYGLSAYATDPIRSKLTQTGEANGMKKETAEIVSAYVGHNTVPADQLPALISSVSEALSMLGQAPVVEEPLAPAVSVRRSVGADAITCLDLRMGGEDDQATSFVRA